jgi:ribosomal protein L3 glutamine methyltransferase
MSLHTIGELLEATEAQFEAAQLSYGHGTDNAFDDACVLLREAMGLAYDADLTQELWHSAVPATAAATFAGFVSRRIQERIPAPYITGKAYVQGIGLYTDPAVIVPRSLLGEILFAGSLDSWLHDFELGEPRSVLDLCTGSGAIAIQAAIAFEHAKVDGVDIEPAAYALAQRNIVLNDVTNQVSVHLGDLYAPVKGKRYDIIVTNPPYVNAASMAVLPAEYLNEPALALAGGVDGMDLVRRIIAGAPQHLNPNGLLVIEIGHEAAYFEAAYPALRFTYLSVAAGDDLVVLIEGKDLLA